MIQNFTLESAIKTSEDFLERAKALHTLRVQAKYHKASDEYVYHFDASEVVQHASVKRISMDLTRLLAKLRSSK